MGRERIICLFLFVVLIFVFSSCHPRHVSDIRPNMTKEEVVSLWGRTDLISFRTVNGKAVETWEYHFPNTNSLCWVTFSQDRVVATQCRPVRGGRYRYYSQPEPNLMKAPPAGQSLVREGSFAMKLAEALKIGEVKSEAEAENKLALVGIAPKNGWIADYSLTPNIIGELGNAIGEAADSGKIAMNKDEAMKAFQGLIADIQSQYAGVEPPHETSPPPSPPPPAPSASGSATSPVPEVQFDVNAPPPEYAFPNPPEVAVIPGTYVYVVPGINVDILFYHGYWYRPYAGRWYFGLSYNGPWVYLDPVRIPRVLLELPPNYRSVPPRYPRIPYGYLRRNWERWERERYWHRNREWREGWRGY
jgi:hypothetical protein